MDNQKRAQEQQKKKTNVPHCMSFNEGHFYDNNFLQLLYDPKPMNTNTSNTNSNSSINAEGAAAEVQLAPLSPRTPSDERLDIDDEESARKKRKRYHAKKACAHCRKAHTACEDERPCKRCKKKGLACFDAESSELLFEATNLLPPQHNNLEIRSQKGITGGVFMEFYSKPMSKVGTNPSILQQQQLQQQQLQLQLQLQPQLQPQLQKQSPQTLTFSSNSSPATAVAAPQTPAQQYFQALSSPSSLSSSSLAENAFIRNEINQLKETSHQQERMLTMCMQRLIDLQNIISRQTEHLSQLSIQQTLADTQEQQLQQSQSQPQQLQPQLKQSQQSHSQPHSQPSQPQLHQQFSAIPIWFKPPGQLLQPVSMWDRNRLVLVGCNESFKSLVEYEQQELTQEFKLFNLMPSRAAPFCEVLLFALLNSSIKYGEFKSCYVVKSGREVYMRNKLHIEEHFFWIEHERCHVVDDEYRLDEYVHEKTFETPYDIHSSQLPPQRIYAFLDVLQRVSELKKPKPIHLLDDKDEDGSSSSSTTTTAADQQTIV